MNERFRSRGVLHRDKGSPGSPLNASLATACLVLSLSLSIAVVLFL